MQSGPIDHVRLGFGKGVQQLSNQASTSGTGVRFLSQGSYWLVLGEQGPSRVCHSPLVQPCPVRQQPQHLQCRHRPILLTLRLVYIIDEHSQPVAGRGPEAAQTHTHTYTHTLRRRTVSTDRVEAAGLCAPTLSHAMSLARKAPCNSCSPVAPLDQV